MRPITIRFATSGDVALLLQLIRELAAYEQAPDAVVATEDDLRQIMGSEPSGGLRRCSRSSTAILPGSRCSTRIFRLGWAGPGSISKTFTSGNGRADSASVGD